MRHNGGADPRLVTHPAVAAVDGVVKALHVATGAQVEPGDLLVELG